MRKTILSVFVATFVVLALSFNTAFGLTALDNMQAQIPKAANTNTANNQPPQQPKAVQPSHDKEHEKNRYHDHHDHDNEKNKEHD